MNALNIIDVSACVYTGCCSKHFVDKLSFGYPVGGIHYLMRQICNTFGLGDSLVLCFDSPSQRSLEFQGYKSGRQRKPEVFSQLKFVYDELLKCGFPCVKYRGYEADDIVAWTVQQQLNNFAELVIIGNDHDLLHSIQNKVRFKSIAQNTACIHIGNFEQMADSSYTFFNTISAKKCLCGCPSDTIPEFRTTSGVGGIDLYNRFLKFLEENDIQRVYEVTTNPKLLLIFAKKSGVFNNEDFIALQKRIHLVYPADCPDSVEIIPIDLKAIDLGRFLTFLSLVNDQDSLECFGSKRVTLSDEQKKIIYEAAHALKSGEFAADNNLPVHQKVTMKPLDLDLFERRF